MQQRYYDPVAGRFLSVDPVTTDAKTGDSFNRYVYAENNPYTFVDPDGRAAFVPVAAGAVTGFLAGISAPNPTFKSVLGSTVAGGLAGGVSLLAVVGKTVLATVKQAGIAGVLGNTAGQTVNALIPDTGAPPPEPGPALVQGVVAAVAGVAGHVAHAATVGATSAGGAASVAATVSAATTALVNVFVPQKAGGIAKDKPPSAEQAKPQP